MIILIYNMEIPNIIVTYIVIDMNNNGRVNKRYNDDMATVESFKFVVFYIFRLLYSPTTIIILIIHIHVS